MSLVAKEGDWEIHRNYEGFYYLKHTGHHTDRVVPKGKCVLCNKRCPELLYTAYSILQMKNKDVIQVKKYSHMVSFGSLPLYSKPKKQV